MPDPIALPALALQRARAQLAGGGRRLLGIAGEPGAGKSTLAQRLAQVLGAGVVVVPMDGFHLASAALARLGRGGRKGAPDTFDAAGYVALLERLRHAHAGEVVYAPAFHREIEEPIAGEIAVPAELPLVITEGNYLLLDESPWCHVRGLLDEVWYLHADPAWRRRHLFERHLAHGRSRDAARAWMARVDEPNAARIRATAARADHQLRWA